MSVWGTSIIQTVIFVLEGDYRADDKEQVIFLYCIIDLQVSGFLNSIYRRLTFWLTFRTVI